MDISGLSSFTSGSVRGEYEYEVHQNHSVFLYQEDSDELYVGGADFVLKLDANSSHVLEVSLSNLVESPAAAHSLLIGICLCCSQLFLDQAVHFALIRWH